MQIEGLKYLNSKHVLHNDIKPQNLFFRGHKVFISGKLNQAIFETFHLKIFLNSEILLFESDFDLSTLNGERNWGCTAVFATARYYGNHTRHPMDDLESLVYSIWWISGVPMVKIKYL